MSAFKCESTLSSWALLMLETSSSWAHLNAKSTQFVARRSAFKCLNAFVSAFKCKIYCSWAHSSWAHLNAKSTQFVARRTLRLCIRVPIFKRRHKLRIWRATNCVLFAFCVHVLNMRTRVHKGGECICMTRVLHLQSTQTAYSTRYQLCTLVMQTTYTKAGSAFAWLEYTVCSALNMQFVCSFEYGNTYFERVWTREYAVRELFELSNTWLPVCSWQRVCLRVYTLRQVTHFVSALITRIHSVRELEVTHFVSALITRSDTLRKRVDYHNTLSSWALRQRAQRYWLNCDVTHSDVTWTVQRWHDSFNSSRSWALRPRTQTCA